METAPLREIKTELAGLHPGRIREICLRMARFRKENKELLSYLLFESEDEAAFVRHAREDMDRLFREVNRNNVYFAKKTIRKILSNTNKLARFSGQKQTETELLLHFCKNLRKTGFTLAPGTSVGIIYHRQVAKIRKTITQLHEDLQYDYTNELSNL